MKEIKCKKCKKKIRLDEKIKMGDITKITEDSIEVYCPFCGNIEFAKLDDFQIEEVKKGETLWI